MNRHSVWNQYLENDIMFDHIPVDITKLISQYTDWCKWLNDESHPIVYILTEIKHVHSYQNTDSILTIVVGIFRNFIEAYNMAIINNFEQLLKENKGGGIGYFLIEFENELNYDDMANNNNLRDEVAKGLKNITDENTLVKMNEYLLDDLPESTGSCWKVEKQIVQ